MLVHARPGHAGRNPVFKCAAPGPADWPVLVARLHHASVQPSAIPSEYSSNCRLCAVSCVPLEKTSDFVPRRHRAGSATGSEGSWAGWRWLAPGSCGQGGPGRAGSPAVCMQLIAVLAVCGQAGPSGLGRSCGAVGQDRTRALPAPPRPARPRPARSAGSVHGGRRGGTSRSGYQVPPQQPGLGNWSMGPGRRVTALLQDSDRTEECKSRGVSPLTYVVLFEACRIESARCLHPIAMVYPQPLRRTRLPPSNKIRSMLVFLERT